MPARRVALRRAARGSAGSPASAPPRRRRGHEAALDADRISGEREADRRHAGEGRARPAVARQPVLRIGRLPEEAEGAPLQIVEKGLGAGIGAAGRGQRPHAQPAPRPARPSAVILMKSRRVVTASLFTCPDRHSRCRSRAWRLRRMSSEAERPPRTGSCAAARRAHWARRNSALPPQQVKPSAPPKLAWLKRLNTSADRMNSLPLNRGMAFCSLRSSWKKSGRSSK